MVNKKARWLLLVAALLGVGLVGHGEVAISVLDVEPGVCTIGMGGAAAGFVPGTETLYYNAAGLSELPGIGFGTSYTSHFGAANYTALGVSFPNVGLGVLLFNTGSIPGYDSEGNPTEDLSYGSTAFLLGFAVDPSQLPFLPTLPLDFSIGGRIKGLTARIGDVKGSGFGLDLAFQTRLGGLPLGPVAVSDVGIGLVVSNLLGSLNYGDHKESLRMDIRLGGAARVAEMVLVAADLELSGSLHVGVEVQAIEALAVRAGLLSQSGGLSLTFGAGVGVAGIQIDYAFISHPGLSSSHRVSLTIDISGLDLTTIGRSLGRLIP
jgi:hypothetical protein